MTENERAVLGALVTSEYHDGNDPVGNPVWANCVAPVHYGGHHVSATSFPGVVASLARKGYVVCSGNNRHDSTIMVTQPGADAASITSGCETCETHGVQCLDCRAEVQHEGDHR